MTPNLPAHAPATRYARAEPSDAGAAGRAGGIRAAYTLAWRRVAAWVIDWLIISAYAVALVPLGLLLVDRSVRLPSLGWNAASFVVLIVPTTVWLAAWEAAARAPHPESVCSACGCGCREKAMSGGGARRRGTPSRSRFRGDWVIRLRSCSSTRKRAGQRCWSA